MRVLPFSNIKLNNIKLKKPIACLNSSYKILIKHSNVDLITQTPILYLIFGITQFGINKYIDLAIIENDTEIMEFREKLLKINSYLTNRIQNTKVLNGIKNKYYYENRQKLEYVNNFKPKVSIYNERLRINLNDSVCYFNENKEKIGSTSIKAKDHVKLLITPSYIWITKEKFGIQWEAIQVKVYKLFIPKSYNFIDEENDNKIKWKNDPVYGKYFDLIKKGVPKQAIKNKLIVLNLNPDIIDNNPESYTILDNNSVNKTCTNLSFPTHPPPPPPLPNSLGIPPHHLY